jgi:hypothetical protein
MLIPGISEIMQKNKSHYKETPTTLHISKYSPVGTEDGSNKKKMEGIF